MRCRAKPVEVLRFLMDQHGLKQKDLADVFGTRSIVSEVLSGKRKLNEEHIERFLIGLETIGKRLRRGRGVGVGNIEQQPIRKNSRRIGQRHVTRGQRFLIPLQAAKTPRRERQRVKLKLQRIFEKAILGLQILRAQHRALHPDDRLQSLHSNLR